MSDHDLIRVAGGRWVAPEELEHERPARRKKARPAPAPAPRKQSYESNPAVQRWLSEQAVDDGRKEPFRPVFLEGRRDADWIISSLGHFYEQDLISDIDQEIKSGKEATVFRCTADPATGERFMAAKIYRPRMFRALSNDVIYREGRARRDEHGKTLRGDRRAPASRALQVERWIAYEYETHRIVYAAGVHTPPPFGQAGNALLMGYVGDEEGPAPRLAETDLERGLAQPMFERLVEDVRRSLLAHRIHGDLSAYNILIWGDEALLIDFAQAVDPRQSEAAFDLLLRDLERLCAAFRPYGVHAAPRELAETLWAEYS
jgi:RIO kinase 1